MKPVFRRIFEKRPSRGFDGAGAVLVCPAHENRFAKGCCAFAQGMGNGRDGADSDFLGDMV
jgi:radical SAM superfamily enzyme